MNKKLMSAALLATLLSPLAVQAEDLIARKAGDIRLPMLTSYKLVKARKDVNEVVRAEYDKNQGLYEYTYVTADGRQKTAAFDAYTGRQVN